jgi:hypothetical protein
VSVLLLQAPRPCNPPTHSTPRQAVKSFLRAPDIFQCDFWELPAVQQVGLGGGAPCLITLVSLSYTQGHTYH